MKLEDKQLDSWVKTEEVVSNYIKQASESLKGFFSETSDCPTYYIQFTDEDHNRQPALNTASYQIATNVLDYQPYFLPASERKSWQSVFDQSKQLLEALDDNTLKNVLPLDTFGLLPLFSTNYRAELISLMKNPLQREDYAIVIRRILYELATKQEMQWTSPQKFEKLHPFHLFGCAKNLLRLKSVLENSTDDDKAVFFKNLLNVKLLTDLIETEEGAKGKYEKEDIDRVYGTDDKNNAFVEKILKNIIEEGKSNGSTILHNLEWIEDAAVNNATSEIIKEKHSNQRQDPSSLAFALLTLSLLDLNRKTQEDMLPARGKHNALISQGTKLIAESCQQGTFPATIPFYIDEKGRALFVTSIEIANALLGMTLNRIELVSDEEINSVLNAAYKVQNMIIEDYKRVDVKYPGDKSEKRINKFGWCSDRAPSSNRIDSWVTAQVLLFFFKHIDTIRWAKRRHILKDYNWTKHQKIKISWKNLVDPDLHQGQTPIKDSIEGIINNKSKGSKAPMFLLYGPPGTSKTTLVEALAKELKWDLIKLSPSDFVVESLDRIEFRSRKIFNDLMNIDKCVILMDELDALLKDRDLLSEKSPGSIMEFVAPALLPKIQELRDHTKEHDIAVFFVTNYYERIDQALSRSGRIDNHLVILPYNKEAQLKVAEAILAVKKLQEPDIETSLKNIKEILEQLPSNLGYRDIDEIVSMTMEGMPNEYIKEQASKLGIPMKTYNPKRTNSKKEFAAFIAKRLELNLSPGEVISKIENDADDFVSKVENNFKDHVPGKDFKYPIDDPDFIQYMKEYGAEIKGQY